MKETDVGKTTQDFFGGTRQCRYEWVLFVTRSQEVLKGSQPEKANSYKSLMW